MWTVIESFISCSCSKQGKKCSFTSAHSSRPLRLWIIWQFEAYLPQDYVPVIPLAQCQSQNRKAFFKKKSHVTPRQTHASRGWSSHDEHVTVACSTCLLSASSRWPYDWTSTEIHYGHLPAAFTIKASIKTDKNVLSVLSDSHSFYKLGKRKKRVNLIEIFAWQHFWLLMFSTAIPVYAFTRAPKQKKKQLIGRITTGSKKTRDF